MNNGQRFTFTKEERVTGEKRIENLFTNGCSFIAYPFKVVFVEVESVSEFPLSILVSIPKKRIKSAVKRNRMKRLVRETYRLNKHLFCSQSFAKPHHFDVAFVYVKNELADYQVVEKAMKKALSELIKHVEREEKC